VKESIVDQILTTHQSCSQADALLNLVTNQLDTSMGMLTLHGPEGDPPRILTSLNMPNGLASAMAESIDRDLARPGDTNGTDGWGAMGWPSTASRGDDGHARITYLHRPTPHDTIGLTACRADHARYGWSERVFLDLKDWVEPILGLIWRAEYEHSLREGLARAIDRFDFGIVLLDADVSPWFVNAAAQRLLDAGDGIRRAGHAIAATDFEDTIRLQTAIRHESVAGDGFHVLLLHRTRAQPLIAVVAALDSERDLWSTPATALYLLDPDRDTRTMVSALCRAHGLTATESVLAVHLVGGATVEDAASRMHIQTQTARAYLKQVFAKTGTHRQAELVRAILAGIVQIG
jgi:DNA-binding CsgD family transcriptional regulator